jgi:hypothetical protein
VKRLYLDTAFIADMADGASAPKVVARLRRALVGSNTVIVVSHAHLIDIARAEDPLTRARVVAFLDTFDCMVAPVIAPRDLEAAALDAVRTAAINELSADDMTFRPLTSVSNDLLAMSDDMHAYETVGGFMAQIADAERAAQAGPRLDGQISKAERRMLASMIRRVLGGEPIERLVGELEESSGVQLDPEMRALLVQVVGPQMAASLPAFMKSLGEAGGTVEQFAKTAVRPGGARSDLTYAGIKGGEERWTAIAPRVAPGTYLASQLRALRRGNLTREIKDSDGADLEHVTFLPYVDLATSDADNVARLSKHLQVARMRPGFALFPNGRVDDVLAAIGRLG